MVPYTTAQIYDMHQRRITTKSNYKMTCGCCGETINRGDEITQMLGSIMHRTPMHLRGTAGFISTAVPSILRTGVMGR